MSNVGNSSRTDRGMNHKKLKFLSEGASHAGTPGLKEGSKMEV